MGLKEALVNLGNTGEVKNKAGDRRFVWTAESLQGASLALEYQVKLGLWMEVVGVSLRKDRWAGGGVADKLEVRVTGIDNGGKLRRVFFTGEEGRRAGMEHVLDIRVNGRWQVARYGQLPQVEYDEKTRQEMRREYLDTGKLIAEMEAWARREDFNPLVGFNFRKLVKSSGSI